MENRYKVLLDRFQDTYRLMLLPDKAYKKFHKKYMGEDISSGEVEEARLLIVKMCIDDIKKDLEVVLDEIQRDREE